MPPIDVLTPDDGDDTPDGQPVEPDDGQGVDIMAAAAEVNIMQAILSGMAGASAAQADRRTSSFDQLASNAAAVWTASLVSPTVMAAMGFRVAQQSGGWPASSGTGTGG